MLNVYIISDTIAGFTYEYFLKVGAKRKSRHTVVGNHLGNTRVSFTDSGGAAMRTQEDSYFPFGMRQDGLSYSNGVENKYLYNGKELQDDDLGGVNLDWYDYGARMYDVALARWHCADPLAEKYYSLSPYNYVANNPIIYIDPDGMKIDWSGVNKEEKRMIKKAIRRLKSSDTFKATYKQIKKSDVVYTFTNKTMRKGDLGDFNGTKTTITPAMTEEGDNGEIITAVEESKNEETPAGTIGVNFNLFDANSKDDVDNVMGPLAEEIVHAGQYDDIVKANGNLVSNFPAPGNREFEAKAIVGQIQLETNNLFQRYGGDKTAASFGQKAFQQKSSIGYFGALQKWHTDPKTDSWYRNKHIDNSTPSYLNKLINR